MKKTILPLLLLLIANTVSAQFTYEFTHYNSTNTPVFSGNNFKCVWVGKGNRIWAGTQYQGLYWFDTARKAWTKSSQLTNVFINQIQIDKDSGIWIAQSGTSGLVGGGSNTAGGVNYFPDTTDAGMQFFSTGNFLSSRNVRGIYVDTVNTPSEGYRRLWVPQATFTTSSNTAAGGITKWQEKTSGNFQRNYLGLQVFPNTNLVSAGTPSCYTACGDKNEVWIGAETNYTIATGSTTQILRYDPTTGQFLGGWDQNGAFDATRLYYNNQARVYTDTSTKGILPAGFRTTAMYIDGEGRRWVGFRNGGLVVKIGNTWKVVNMPSVIPSGTMVNFNAITSDEFGYVYIGTSNGLIVFDNGGDVTDTTAYKRITTTDSLPSNNITGVAYDKAGGRMIITSDAGVTFMKYNYRLRVSMEWDYSYPQRVNNPIGVAADGVARIYLKIKKRNDTLPSIMSVNVKLKSYSAARANERGKLKKALIIDRYSEEASSGTTDDVTINRTDVRAGLPDEYWLWYVAPEDFCSDSASNFASLRRRFDTLVMVATYANNTKDTMEYKIGIVRPPTLFVHGLASDPTAWNNLSHNNFGNYTPFVTSPLFTYKRALTMDPIGVFYKNGAQLLGADVSAYKTDDRLNTLQGNIEAMRNNMRYAANKVDYVCHSMGGIMIRTAIGVFARKFFSGASDPYIFKNYDSGYTHKVITINTPHNGAPVADVLDQYIPKADGALRIFLNDAFCALPQQQALGGLLRPEGNPWIDAFGAFKVTDAINNLQVTEARGGVTMLNSPVKYHMLCSNVNWTKYNQSDMGAIDYGLSRIYGLVVQIAYYNTYNTLEYPNIFEAAQTRSRLKDMMALEKEHMLAEFLNFMAERRNYHNYITYSDVIVPVKSQTAQQDENTSPFISKFLGNDTITIQIPIKIPVTIIPPLYYTTYRSLTIIGLNGNHSAVLSRNDVGQRVFQLLNTKLSSNAFSNNIPADTDDETPYFLRPATPGDNGIQNRPTALLQTFYDTTKIKIDAPVRNGNVTTDSIFQVMFRIKDTAKLAYYTIRFQNTDSFRVIKTRTQQSIDFVPNASFTGSSKIWATAVYENAAGNGVDFYVDSVTVTPNNLATLQGFRVKEDVAEIIAGRTYYPEYEVNYNGNWISLPVATTGISVSIDSATVVQQDALSKSFTGLKDGSAIVNFAYNGFTDSMLIKVITPYNYNCINRTIAGGNFKNPAIWSKGVVPEICDSVIISTGHTVTVDTSIIVRAVRINSGGILTINNAAYMLQLGQGDDAVNLVDNYGTLNITNGNLYVNGRVKHNTASTFTMSGGTITIDGNKGTREASIADGIALFEAAAGMASFNFSGGTLQLNNPPYGAASQALSCPYDFGNNSLLILGINTSSTASKNPDGFGGLSFPNKIGRLVINAGTRNGNRQFVNKKALTIKTNAEVRTGSGVIIQAPITVNQ